MKTKYSFLKVILLLWFCFLCVNLRAQIIADGNYVIFSSVHNETITAPTVPDYDAFMITPNTSDTNQVWTFTHLGNDLYTIQNMETGNYLGLKDNWCGQFGDVQAKFQGTDDNIAFKVINGGTTNTFVIEIGFTNCGFGSVNSPIRAWDIQEGAVGAQIQTFDEDINNVNQQFQVFPTALLSVDDFDSQDSSFSVNPNPAREILTVRFSQKLYPTFNAKIVSLQRQLVTKIEFRNNSVDEQINISNLNDDFHFLRFLDKDYRMVSSKKILISNR